MPVTYLGCFTSCETISFGTAVEAGLYVVSFRLRNRLVKHSQEFNAGDNIIFDNLFNEYQYFRVSIKKDETLIGEYEFEISPSKLKPQ